LRTRISFEKLIPLKNSLTLISIGVSTETHGKGFPRYEWKIFR
jgi:hypothetical protein